MQNSRLIAPQATKPTGPNMMMPLARVCDVFARRLTTEHILGRLLCFEVILLTVTLVVSVQRLQFRVVEQDADNHRINIIQQPHRAKHDFLWALASLHHHEHAIYFRAKYDAICKRNYRWRIDYHMREFRL